MRFRGQFNFGYPITSQNIIKDVPSDAVLPLSIGSSLQGNILGIKFEDLKSQLLPVFSNENTAYGSEALANITTGYGNTALGYRSLLNTNTGVINTAIGGDSLINNTTGNRNVAVGYYALVDNVTGSANVAVGTDALVTNVSGINNSVLGDNIQVGVAGSNNSIIGYGARALGYNSSVVLGSDAAATANNQFVVGSIAHNAGTITTETITANRTWTVRINGANYKIPLLAI